MVNDYASRLEWAMKRAGVSPQSLADELEISLQAVRKLLAGASKAMNSTNNAKAAQFLRVESDWLATGSGAREISVAHSMSLPAFDTPSLTFEEVTMQLTNLPPQFVFAVPDGALGAMYPKGTRFLWSTAREPMAERILLVRDQYGEAHVRQYHRGAQPGQWSAAALSPSYPSFDGSTVNVLAVAQTEMRDLP
jgi:hypothetical protein